MCTYQNVLLAIKQQPQYGHSAKMTELNIESLKKADAEIRANLSAGKKKASQ